MELTVQVGVVAAIVLAIASIFGGIVLYRGSKRVGWRAVGMSTALIVEPNVAAPGQTDEDVPEPDYTIQALSELLGIVDAA